MFLLVLMAASPFIYLDFYPIHHTLACRVLSNACLIVDVQNGPRFPICGGQGELRVDYWTRAGDGKYRIKLVEPDGTASSWDCGSFHIIPKRPVRTLEFENGEGGHIPRVVFEDASHSCLRK